jgi:hypothetical protein
MAVLEHNEPLNPGTETKYGTVKAVLCLGGERYYAVIEDCGNVALIPAGVVEPPIVRVDNW